ncbi:non-muscle cofilin 1-like [Kryptolebias marmoratus]|uniref:Cofilin-1-A n=1 Tax=Kryptolebias marmoratus TaxID=37003 RepID=A0A3Q3AUG1_KRYMA|nr:non-muscle cofilin 1-like [Kryptolebias marmoratus]
MASGVKVSDKVKDIINEMKVVKSDSDSNERIRLVIFHIDSGLIEIEKIYREKDFSSTDDVFKFFVSQMKTKTCRYLLYDCHFETKEASKKEELVFVMWACECASIKEKMQYASSKDSLKKVMAGIKHELQINDRSDLGSKETFAERIGRNVVKLEGCSVRE